MRGERREGGGREETTHPVGDLCSVWRLTLRGAERELNCIARGVTEGVAGPVSSQPVSPPVAAQTSERDNSSRDWSSFGLQYDWHLLLCT